MDNYFENTFDALVDFFNTLPKETVKILNVQRYKLMLETAANLRELLYEIILEGEITIDVNYEFNLGSISIELDSLTIDNPKEFIKVIRCADNFEVYPLTNGKIRFDITFQSVLKTLLRGE